MLIYNLNAWKFKKHIDSDKLVLLIRNSNLEKCFVQLQSQLCSLVISSRTANVIIEIMIDIIDWLINIISRIPSVVQCRSSPSSLI